VKYDNEVPGRLAIVTPGSISKGAMMTDTSTAPSPDDGVDYDVVSLEPEPGPDEPEAPAEEPGEPTEEPEAPAEEPGEPTEEPEEPAEPTEPTERPAARPNLW
jgi:hypothetical protein